MPAKDTIIANIRAVADASNNLDLRRAIGAPGQRLQIRGETFDSGVAWAIPGFVDAVMSGLGQYLDALAVAATIAWARIDTRPTGQVPVVQQGGRVSTVGKTPDTVVVNFSTPFSVVPVVLAKIENYNEVYIIENVTTAVSSAVLRFRDPVTTPLSIDDRIILVAAFGAG